MKFKYTGTITKTVNYAENKYLYLVPGCEFLISNKGFESKKIQALIKDHKLKIIPVQAGSPIKVDIKIDTEVEKENNNIIEGIKSISKTGITVKDAIKKSKKKKKRSIKKTIKDIINNRR